MIRYLNTCIILLFFAPHLAFGWGALAASGGGANAAVGCASCSGNATFIWECNSTTVGDTGFSPCGCSDGDTGASSTGGATITSGAAVFDDTVSQNGNDYYSFDNGSDVLSDDTLGTVFIRFKVDTWVNDTRFWRIFGDANNRIQLTLFSNDDISAVHEGNNTFKSVSLIGNYVNTGTEYILRYRWQTGVPGSDHQLTLYDTSMMELENNTDDDDLVAFTTQAGSGDYRVGNDGGDSGSKITIYYVHQYNEWKDTDPNGP